MRADFERRERCPSEMHDDQVKHACYAFGFLMIVAIIAAASSIGFQEVIANSSSVEQPNP
jgi:hypothetical protein